MPVTPQWQHQLKILDLKYPVLQRSCHEKNTYSFLMPFSARYCPPVVRTIAAQTIKMNGIDIARERSVDEY